MKKKPRFFCDFCGNEVHQNDVACKHCGKFFSAVRCPACGKTGNAALFSKGCPACGYAFNPSAGGGHSAKDNFAGDFSKNDKKTSKVSNDQLPIWIYLTTFGGVLALILIIFFMYR